MDPAKKYREAYNKAKIIWENEEDTDSDQEGEGVVTRNQARSGQITNQNQSTPETIDFSQIPNFDNDQIESERQEVESPSLIQPDTNESELPNLFEPQINESESEEDNPEPHNIGRDIFNKDTLIAENDLVKVYVIKTFLKRQKKFNLQDHQYILHFKKKTNKPILLKHVLDILE
jgi:hypothetical protein